MSFSVDIKNVSKSFQTEHGVLTPLKDVNLRISAGCCTAVVGKSGCGKTTLLRLIAGLDRPDRGEILFEQENHPYTPSVSYVFQDPRLLPWKTVKENLSLAVREHSDSEQNQLIKDALDLVCLSQSVGNLYPSQLSGGMAQRVGLARGIISKPDIILLDEPFSALDFMTRTKLQVDFSSLLNDISTTTIMITHDVNEAIYLSRQVAYLNDGVISDLIPIDVPMPREISDDRLLGYQKRLLGIILK